MALSLKKSYSYVDDQMTNWLPTRFLAATVDLDDDLTCEGYFTDAVGNDTNVNITQVCSTLKFDDLDSVYKLALANKQPSLKSDLMNITNMTDP
jgi:hypothetical protein